MPAQTSQTGSIYTGPGGQDRTGTALSSQIIISVAGTPVGAIQSMSVSEDRQVEVIGEVGSAGALDSAPIKFTRVTGDCKRIRFDGITITESFGRDFLHIASQRIPFDITIIDSNNGDGVNSIITTINNVWITKLSVAYQADNYMIVDDMSWVAETIYSTLPSGASAATSGPRGFNLQTNSAEQATDVGKNRDALNAPGLINAIFQ